MNLIKIYQKFPDQEACIEHLEKLRWADKPKCPHCNSHRVARKGEADRVGRWNCHSCHASFNVMSKTIMQKTRVPLQKWFLAIGLMVNAKKSISSCQLARDLEMTQPTALLMQYKIRSAMVSDQQPLLCGIVEADETYVGGKPRKSNKRSTPPSSPRGRGTKKVPVIGVVERNGQVRAEVAGNLTARNIIQFIRKNVDTLSSLLITDEFKGYTPLQKEIAHAVINHQRQYVDGVVHTNTIEGFWSLVKRSWMGSHHHYSKKWMPLYIAEQCWKYNNRRNDNSFNDFMQGVVS